MLARHAGLALGALIASACGGEPEGTYVATSGGADRGGRAGHGDAASTDEPDDGGAGESPSAGGEPAAGGSSATRDDAGAPSALPASATSVVRFTDERGDVEPWPGMLRYPLDLLAVRVETVGDELVVRYQFSRTLAEHFAFPGVDGERTAGAPCELYVDLDDDPGTGVEPIWADESEWADELRGYELELDVLLVFEFRSKSDGSEGSAGGDVILNDEDHEITGYFADYWFIDQTADGSLGPSDPDAGLAYLDTRDLTVIDGDVIELHVPLAWLDVASGDVLRLMYREKDQGPASGVGYSRNARLRVR